MHSSGKAGAQLLGEVTKAEATLMLGNSASFGLLGPFPRLLSLSCFALLANPHGMLSPNGWLAALWRATLRRLALLA